MRICIYTCMGHSIKICPFSYGEAVCRPHMVQVMVLHGFYFPMYKLLCLVNKELLGYAVASRGSYKNGQ